MDSIAFEESQTDGDMMIGDDHGRVVVVRDLIGIKVAQEVEHLCPFTGKWFGGMSL